MSESFAYMPPDHAEKLCSASRVKSWPKQCIYESQYRIFRLKASHKVFETRRYRTFIEKGHFLRGHFFENNPQGFWNETIQDFYKKPDFK